MSSLLSPNSSKLERVLELGLHMPLEVWEAAGRVGDILDDIPDEAVLFLVWELGLEPVLPYIREARRAIRDGSAWQAVRGTPDAIEMALGWIGESALVEEMPESFNWNRYQLGLERVPEQSAELESHVALAKMSAPHFMRLIRIYAGYDRRTARVNGSRVNGGGRVNDWSGVRWKDDWPKLSFGRHDEIVLQPAEETIGTAEIQVNYTTRSSHGFYVNRSNVNGSARGQLRQYEISGGVELQVSWFDDQPVWPCWPQDRYGARGSWRDIRYSPVIKAKERAVLCDEVVEFVQVTGELVTLFDESAEGADWPMDEYPAWRSWREIERAGAIYEVDNR